jgi:hypothetical protein
MKQTFNILIVLLLCLPTIISAQNGETAEGEKPVCGTEFTPAMEARLLQNIETAKRLNLPSANRTTTYVKMKFHLVGNNDGSGRISRAKVLDAVCALNQNYADQDVVFYVVGMYEMNNTVVNTHSNVSAAQFQMSIKKNQNNDAINVFVCSSISTSNNSPGTTLGYYSPQYDIIVLRANQVNASSSTFTHEAGHFFSLPHPFNGWEGTDYHANYSASNPPPASVGGNLVELADGSNCSNAGDYFCDTEADYNLGFGWTTCNYNNGAVDPTGALVDPDESLYMGYFQDVCQNKFSGGQKGAIAADLASFGRNYVKGTPASTVAISAPTNLVSPADNGTTQFWDEVYLNWDDTPDATQYLVQIARNQSFSLMVEEAIVTNSIFTSNVLNPGTAYFWRVKAFNEVSPCNSFSPIRKFTTSSFTVSTKETFTNTSIAIRPSVAKEGQFINLDVNTTSRIDATIRIINVNGQVMRNAENVTFQEGTHTHRIETAGLAPGVYIVNMQTATGQINERLLITE